MQNRLNLLAQTKRKTLLKSLALLTERTHLGNVVLSMKTELLRNTARLKEKPLLKSAVLSTKTELLRNAVLSTKTELLRNAARLMEKPLLRSAVLSMKTELLRNVARLMEKLLLKSTVLLKKRQLSLLLLKLQKSKNIVIFHLSMFVQNENMQCAKVTRICFQPIHPTNQTRFLTRMIFPI